MCELWGSGRVLPDLIKIDAEESRRCSTNGAVEDRCWFEDKSWNITRLEHMYISFISLLDANGEDSYADINYPTEWEASSQGVMKINCDASVNISLRKAGVCSIARDSTALICDIYSNYYNNISSVNEAEGRALSMGMHLCIGIGVKHAIFEIDASDVFKGVLYDYGPMVLIFGDILGFMTAIKYYKRMWDGQSNLLLVILGFFGPGILF